MNVMKRDGREVPYQSENIINAVTKANESVSDLKLRLSPLQIKVIEEEVRKRLSEMSHTVDIEEIQDLVIHAIMKQQAYQVAQNYTEYRYKQALIRKKNTTDDAIFSLIEYENEEIKQENSNKNPRILSTQRDYLAGEVSRDITKRILLPKEIVDAQEEGVLHFHDSDYFVQHMHNCDLVNLEDMLQNGTVITDTMIETPKSLDSASNIATQITAQVASNQYGGQTFTLSHLAPFVDVSRQKYRRRVRESLKQAKNWDEEELEACVDAVAESCLKNEIKAAMQKIQYQLITLMTTNGQTPFVSIFLYLDEVPKGRLRDDFAMLIEEVLNQRILGIKNKNGDYITPAFPKLLYVLDEDNVRPGAPYYYLTELAAKCTAKRMVPDYISAKIMKKYKGDVYPCMGCVDKDEIITYRHNRCTRTTSFRDMWDNLSGLFEVKTQENGHDFYMETPGVEIYDQKRGFVTNYGIIKNHATKWLKMTFWKKDTHTNKKVLTCTPDHPFDTENRGVVLAEDMTKEDIILSDKHGEMQLKNVKAFEKEDFSYDVTTESEHFTVSGLYSHNCRSFLTPDRVTEKKGNVAHAKNYKEGEHKYYGRFNQGVVTINLVDVALSSGKDEKRFWDLLEDRLELCHRALRLRHERLLGTPSDVAPILWQHGALARLKPGEVIDPLLYDGYSTISLGYAGIYEMTKYMVGESHSEPKGKEFALAVMQKMNDKCNEWKANENIDYSLYGTPLESTVYSFAKKLQKRFGVVKDITDHGYITNSYHINVREKINAFDKLSIEAEFQALSPGGAISYVEAPDLTRNIPAVLAIMTHIYENIMYAEINIKSDHCQNCGYDGEIKIVERNGKLIWQCPECECEDERKLNVSRRTCGYIGTQFWNQGRTEEIRDRVIHVSLPEFE